MISIAFFSNSIGSFLFLILTVLLLINWRGKLVGTLLILASLLSTLWFSFIAYNANSGDIPLITIKIIETLRDASWLSFLFAILRQRPDASMSNRFKYVVPIAIVLLTLIVLLSIIFNYQLSIVYASGVQQISISFFGYLIMSLLGLLLVEHLYKSTTTSARWTIKYLCLGIGGIFAYDFVLYSEALLFNRINPDLWFVRGAINGICVPMIAISVARNPQWKMELFVSRHVVYQSTATTVAGVYLIVMAVAGYYIRNFGGTWGGALQIIFLFGAIMLLIIIIFSEHLRVKLKLFLAEHFYRNKYDYRQEWLGITKMLSDNNDANIYTTIVRAVINTMNCSGGALWLQNEDGIYRKKTALNYYEKTPNDISMSKEMIEMVVKKHTVINLDYYKDKPDTFDNIVIPAQLQSGDDVWLFIALVNNDSLIGFVMLTRPHSDFSYGAEDEDLLKTVGFQVASYIALLIATDDLAEARQFEVFNRLSAFVVHDLKNLVAQLSLINTNAKKYRQNPEFIDDVFSTIENSVAKMSRLLVNLRKEKILGTQPNQHTSIAELLSEVIDMRSVEKPVPFASDVSPGLSINIERDKLLSVLEHLVQNAQEATPEKGEVELAARSTAHELCITVRDTGTGMDDDFIRNRLFKPFDTTKGNAGMGIGVYESREIIKAMGGSISVESAKESGTVFTITLPNPDLSVSASQDTEEKFQ